MNFDTTRWSVVVAAGGDDSAARAALSALCEAYWYPLYAYVRQRGVPAEDARDLTQAFLASLIERRDLKRVTPERGRFRSFLLASLQHFLANDAVRQRTQKRGGGVHILSLDSGEARPLSPGACGRNNAGCALRAPLGLDGHRPCARAAARRLER